MPRRHKHLSFGTSRSAYSWGSWHVSVMVHLDVYLERITRHLVAKEISRHNRSRSPFNTALASIPRSKGSCIIDLPLRRSIKTKREGQEDIVHRADAVSALSGTTYLVHRDADDSYSSSKAATMSLPNFPSKLPIFGGSRSPGAGTDLPVWLLALCGTFTGVGEYKLLPIQFHPLHWSDTICLHPLSPSHLPTSLERYW